MCKHQSYRKKAEEFYNQKSKLFHIPEQIWLVLRLNGRNIEKKFYFSCRNPSICFDLTIFLSKRVHISVE